MRGLLLPHLLDCRLPIRRLRNRREWPGHGVNVTARDEIPFGLDRLVFLWAMTMAGERGRGFAFVPTEIGRMFGLDWKRGEVMARLERVRGMIVEVWQGGDDDGGGDGRGLFRKQVAIEALKIGAHECWIELGPMFARERAVPISLDVVAECARRNRLAPLDLYLWQCMAAHGLDSPRRVDVLGEDGVLRRLGSGGRHARKARQQMRAWHGLIRGLWRSCPHYLTDDGNQLVLIPGE